MGGGQDGVRGIVVCFGGDSVADGRRGRGVVKRSEWVWWLDGVEGLCDRREVNGGRMVGSPLAQGG